MFHSIRTKLGTEDFYKNWLSDLSCIIFDAERGHNLFTRFNNISLSFPVHPQLQIISLIICKFCENWQRKVRKDLKSENMVVLCLLFTVS
jgi:hypothetical protein